MKIKRILSGLIFICGFCILNAQVNPTPAPPKSPAPVPSPPKAPAPPPAKSKQDTTRIHIGEKQILIIENDDKDEDDKSWEKELEEEMMELKSRLENRKKDKNRTNEELFDEEKELLQAEKELQKAEKELEQAQKDMKKSKKDRDTFYSDKNENKAPGDKGKFKWKENKEKKSKAADIDLLDIDFGLNFLRIDGNVSQQMEDDLKLKTWGSWTYTFTFLPTKIFLGSPHFMIMTGLGWRIGQFEFKNKVDFEPKKTLVYSVNDALKSSQFIIHQLQIPVSFYSESKKIRGLGKIGAGIGVYGGILLCQQLETTTENPDRFIETNEEFGFEDFRYGISARIDIGALKLFSNFDLNRLWKGNDFKNIEAGIWIDF
jgi:hypothetical protein